MGHPLEPLAWLANALAAHGKELKAGAALAVYHHGELVLDLYGGLADQTTGRPVDESTMFVLYSSTKPVTAACLHILWERGRLRWEDRVADHWPEFAQSGKEEVTIGQVLTHRGGFPDSPSHMTWDRWSDWNAAVKAMEDLRPDYPPGRVIAYHPRNFGWVIGELVRRIDGRPINRFVREEITRPLGINDLYIGLPEWLLDRVSRLHAMEDCDRRSQVDLYNRPELGGTLDGATIMQPETVQEVISPHSEGIDHSLNRRVIRGMGLSLADPRTGDPEKLDPHTFGHAGSGTSVGWANPDTGLAVAYITNGFRAEISNTPRLAAISQAVTDACL
ncbi:Beta-lactamase domain-containing protein 2 [Geodia barretti]|uniref:Beta-lactamase domain-containing protein 2 n=1 Tax=Geodia barretti TaxID=519541 RepID=A0AA35T8V0_GEOBA|nr:Beta-lactamase domain-containing protein 2 [Geodia barretti]